MWIATPFDRPVVTTDPYARVRDAVALMREHGAGAVVVVQQDAPIAMLTDRDVALAVGRPGYSPD